MIRKAHKFGAVRTEYNGFSYASKLEARHARNLDVRLQLGEVTHWKPQPPAVPLFGFRASVICYYRPDFFVAYADGTVGYEEAKGFETPEWKLKEKLFRDSYPETKLTVFYSPRHLKPAEVLERLRSVVPQKMRSVVRPKRTRARALAGVRAWAGARRRARA